MSSENAVDMMRHSCAHLMAAAIQQLWPEAKFGVGPTTERGFYYDFLLDQPITEDDLSAIEKAMIGLKNKQLEFVREEVAIDDAIAQMQTLNQPFKVELLKLLKEKGSTAVAAETGDDGVAGDSAGGVGSVSFYKLGSFTDLCRGPHIPATNKIGAFKLMSIAGAYWRGKSENPQMQRIYAFCYPNKEELNQAIWQIEEAKKRDHRKLGREMKLFHLQDEAAGSVFWHPRGWVLWRTLENYVRERLQQSDYVEVKTPQLYDSSLFKASGHWDMYGDNMYKLNAGDAEHEQIMCLKPMNCPAHVQIFKNTLRSYRELPMRMAEFGACLRNEASGALHGIMRVRAFTQDDAHIFCREDQIESEALRYFELQIAVYRDLGFEVGKNISVKLALRPDKRAGSDELWDKAEDGLRTALRAAGFQFEEMPNEGAFYGPKVEFHLIDSLGRSWQCGTIQLDFVLPERLDADYIGEDSQRHRPVMLHRAILGSFERFIGILIEHFGGKFPLWLAPVQAVVATVTSEAEGYAREVAKQMKAAGLRVELDLRNEKIGYKIREHSLEKIPVLVVVGAKEAESQQVVLRRLGVEAQDQLSLSDAVAKLADEAKLPVFDPEA
jgi:threonyl-tRNA synthetase